MPVYAYKGVDQRGKSRRGFVDAESLRSARSKLRRDGVFLTDISEGGSKGRGRVRGDAREEGSRLSLPNLRRISAMDMAMATRQLATLIGAGIPLVESLSALTEQVETPRLKGVIGIVRDRVNEGNSLADALAETGAFTDLYVSMVRAGEAGGALEQVLDRLADYVEGQVRLQNKVLSIILYPLVMLAFALCVIVAVVTVVLPQITQLLESLNQPLPWFTRFMIGLSDFVRTWWWALGLGAFAAWIAFRTAVRTERGRVRWDAIRLRMPYLGRLTRLLAISRFTRTLSTLLAGGIPIVRSLQISKFVANNAIIGQAIDHAAESLTEGATLAAPLRSSGEFPPMVTHMVDVGERSGELEPMLAKIADTYDEQVENAVTRITALLEPILILLMVVIVLIIIMSVLAPMLEITGSIQ
jgi:general secretion pathway protein F